MDTRKIKVFTKAPTEMKTARKGSWKELLFARMPKPGYWFAAKLTKNDKAAIYSTIYQAKASGKFSLRTLDNGKTQVIRLR